ncbi:hypothetical protein FGG08_002436 [Glutinoglossum americanum]|uniref:SAM-dependent MTase RsmB/NOP-type domain-containing protein n=1 Tax=Glutinoglossum americanum TaxID=1670608 RepID=A0A9P8I9A7_9PEZI|nr:hypothetical protein FGG08_002436 [Glutinoglossum americanum]
MSLYHEAASILTGPVDVGGSLKSRVYNNKTLKSSPAHLYALVSETIKWSGVLREVIERSQLLSVEKKVRDAGFRSGSMSGADPLSGIDAATSHPLKLAITRHKARLNAEFIKARLRRGFPSIDALKTSINLHGGTQTEALTNGSAGENGNGEVPTRPLLHPRWVRINALRTTLETQLETTFADYSHVDSLALLEASSSRKVLHIDRHVPDLLALPPGADLANTAAYLQGDIIFQDKASCFPAYLLDPSLEDGEFIDACAAPGNKTTHLASLLSKRQRANGVLTKNPSIWAFERDKSRALILKRMVETAGANHMVTVKPEQDSLRVDPESEAWRGVGALLLDPSCSGSGMVGRDEMPRLVLPSRGTEKQAKTSNKKKRRREPAQEPKNTKSSIVQSPQDEEESLSGNLSQRLSSLSAFQLKLLLHAFRFKSARKVVYSTCSIHAEENEHVVVRALNSDIAKRRRWRVLRREEQVPGLRGWGIRGALGACEGLEGGHGGATEVVADACLKCSKGGKEGTMGFFVVGFVRDSVVDGDSDLTPESGDTADWNEEEDEWEGFSDGGLVAPSAAESDQGRCSSGKTSTGREKRRKK